MLRIMMRTMLMTIVTMTILMTMLTMVHGKRTDIVSSIDKNMTEIVSPIDENELEIVSTMYENEPERVSTMNLTETKKQFSWNDTRIFMGPNNHYLTPENTLDATHISTITAANLIGIPANSYVMYWIRDRSNPSLVDSMIFLDCAANIGLLLSIFLHYPKLIWQNIPFCIFTMVIEGGLIAINKTIPVTTAVYRYILVCRGRDTFNS